MSVFSEQSGVFEDIAESCGVNLSWMQQLNDDISNQEEIDADQLVKTITSHGRLSGPHKITLLVLKGQENTPAKKTVILICGEVHGNPNPCDGDSTVFKVVSDVLRRTSNVFLVLESFFHLIPKTVDQVKELSRQFDRLGKSQHSIASALKCISSSPQVVCTVNDDRIGELILFRAFSFVVQSVAAYLNSVGVSSSKFHDLSTRVHPFDLREDVGLIPYSWIKAEDKNQFIREMLKTALPKMRRFVPELFAKDLRDLYEERVHKSIVDVIEMCIHNPTQEAYEDVFTRVTELVSVATIFHIMETYTTRNPHVVVVVGDAHRELIVHYLKQCLGENILSEHTFSGRSTSCVNVN